MPSEPVCFLERHPVLEQKIWFIVQKMVSVIVKIAAVTFELLHGASACLPLPATVTQILSLQEVCVFGNFL